MEYWQIELWENDDGVCRVDRDLLKKIRRKEKFLYKSLKEKMFVYIQMPINKIELSKDLEKVKGEEKMWELKFHLGVELRFLGCRVSENNLDTFYALYAFKKKDQTIKNQHRYVARERIKEFINNFKNNELQKIL
jgi:hypothetical protein